MRTRRENGPRRTPDYSLPESLEIVRNPGGLSDSHSEPRYCPSWVNPMALIMGGISGFAIKFLQTSPVR